MAKVRAGSLELEVTIAGQGMPVLLAHGFPLDHSMWDEQVGPLAARAQVIAPDLRGFGGSQVIPGTATMEQMADDLNALLDALAIEVPVVFCGLSMGGYVAFQFWRKYRPRLRALVLCDTRAIADTSEAASGRLKLASSVLTEGTHGLAMGLVPKMFSPTTLENQPELVAAQREIILAAPPEGVATALRGLAARSNVSDYLPQIAVPTLVVVGQDDAISPLDEMRGIAAAIPHAEFVSIPRAGHMSPLENPVAFNEALEQFLARVERDR